jgi:hypothetical protein
MLRIPLSADPRNGLRILGPRGLARRQLTFQPTFQPSVAARTPSNQARDVVPVIHSMSRKGNRRISLDISSLSSQLRQTLTHLRELQKLSSRQYDTWMCCGAGQHHRSRTVHLGFAAHWRHCCLCGCGEAFRCRTRDAVIGGPAAAHPVANSSKFTANAQSQASFTPAETPRH